VSIALSFKKSFRLFDSALYGRIYKLNILFNKNFIWETALAHESGNPEVFFAKEKTKRSKIS
jgi:hypothetical protein